LRTRSAQEGAQACQQLPEVERFGDVVVGAGVEPGDPVLDLYAGSEYQHRRLVARGAKLPADLEPVDARHQHVEDDRVDSVPVILHPLERLGAVFGGLHLVVLDLQCPLECLAQRLLVIDNEDSHGS
jgi:hypothetical protein